MLIGSLFAGLLWLFFKSVYSPAANAIIIYGAQKSNLGAKRGMVTNANRLRTIYLELWILLAANEISGWSSVLVFI